jgi:hypothetical protein
MGASRGRHFWDCAVTVNEVEVENVATSSFRARAGYVIGALVS